MISVKRVPDNNEIRKNAAISEYQNNKVQYKEKTTYNFRATTVEQAGTNKNDFKLITHPEPLNNPGHISVNCTLPRFLDDKEQKKQLKKEMTEGLKDKQEWALYHKKLPGKHVPLANSLPDRFTKKEKDQHLSKEQWEPAYTLISRLFNDTKIVGKPPI